MMIFRREIVRFLGCLVFFGLVISVFGCAPRITRSGYIGPDKEELMGPCEATLQKYEVFKPGEAKELGWVMVGDSAFSTNCEESDVIPILRREACWLGANVINIVEEARAGAAGSSCYTVRAELLEVQGEVQEQVATDDPRFKTKEIEKREEKDRKTKAAIVALSIVGAIAGGLAAGLSVAAAY